MFPEVEFKSIDEQKLVEEVKGGMFSCFGNSDKQTTSKVYKIKYSLNLLPSIGTYINKDIDLYTKKEVVELANNDINLLEDCSGSEELSIFETDTL